MRNRWPGIYNLYNDWANVAYYSIYLTGGVLFACHPALEHLAGQEWRRSLALGIAASGVLLVAVLGVLSSPVVLLVGSAVAGWCFVVAFLGMARRFFTTTSPALAYLSESAFPVYVLHQAAIVLPGYFIIRLPLGVAPKFGLLLVVAVALTLAAYHWLVRPFVVPRFLLGMRPRACSLRTPVAVSPSVAALVAMGLGLVLAERASGETPVGVWNAEGGAARVAIEPCGDELCGRVVWLRSPFDDDGCELRDRHNPDPTLRRREVIGVEILRGLTPRSDGSWRDGRLYDPTSGNTYTCHLTLEGDDRLRLRGYVGIPLIGRTTTWIRVGAEKRLCRGDGR